MRLATVIPAGMVIPTGMVLVAGMLLAACADTPATPPPRSPTPTEETVRVLLVGDVMLGRGVTSVVANQPNDVFAEVRHLLAEADIAGANLESPLTVRAHTSGNENRLEADPAVAAVLADAGFDLMSLPNNHSTDAGGDGLLDTIAAVQGAGLLTVGAGVDRLTAWEPTIVDTAGLSVGFLAFDATEVGATAGADPGVATWDDAASPAAVRELRPDVDVLVVSVHGGTEYLTSRDPGMERIGGLLADAGADVVWGHGAHLVQSVTAGSGDRPTVVATSLGNFLFDQSGPGRTTGAMLEVLADADGVIAYRVGIAEHPDRRVAFKEWLPPSGDAAWLDDSWWTLTRVPALQPQTTADLEEFRHGDLVVAATGDITGDGIVDVVASFRRPHQTTPFMEVHPEVQWEDASGRDAHVGVYTTEGLDEVWVAGSVLLPVAQLAVCDGSLAVAHDQLDDPAIVASGAWEWNGFGFDTAPDIPGRGIPGCADIDGDGHTEPVIVAR